MMHLWRGMSVGLMGSKGFTIAHDWNGQDFGVPAGLCVIEDATE